MAVDLVGMVNPFKRLADAFHDSSPQTPPGSGVTGSGGASAVPAGPPRGSGGLAAWDPTTATSSGAAANDAQRWSTLYGIDQGLVMQHVRTRTAGEGNIGAIIENYFRLPPGDPKLEEIQRQLYRGGFYGNTAAGSIPFGTMDNTTVGALAGALTQAARYGVDGHTTLEDVLETGIGGPSVAGGRQPSTTTQVNYSSELQAGGALRSAMESLLGRAPTAAEVRGFHGALNAAEADNPSVRTETPNGAADTDVTTSGGLSEGDYSEMARQAATGANGRERNRFGIMDYMQAFEQAIGG